MLRKFWKHSLTGLGVLLFIAIGGVLYYLNSNNIRKEPIKIYGVTELPKKETHGEALPSIKNDMHRPSNDQRGAKTADTSGATPTTPSSNNVDPNTTFGDAAQQDSDLKKSQQNDKGNDEGLTKEEIQNRILQVEEFQASLEKRKTRLQELQNSLQDIKKRDEARQYELAKRLNSLSAEKQLAYFEEEYLSGKTIAKEFMSAFFGRLNTEGAARGYSEQTEKLIEAIKQAIPETTDEEMINQHIEKLRKYGFKPKF